MSSVPALFPRFSGRDLEIELELETQLKTELETKLDMDLEMVGFHLEIHCLHSYCTQKCNQINF